MTVRIHNSHNKTEAHKTHNHTYSDTKWNQKNMTECDKRNSHINSKLHVTCISSDDDDRHSLTETFTTLHCLPYKLHPGTLHYHLIWLNPISIYQIRHTHTHNTHSYEGSTKRYRSFF